MYAAQFNAIQAAYPSVDLLGLPAWKWAALVEAWAWAHIDEEHRDKLERDLSRPVDFAWAKRGSSVSGGAIDVRRPESWQTNTKGEVLLSGKKRKAT